MFYNKILADKKPYFFRYKYNFLNKEYNEYVKKNNENAQIRFACTLNELLLKEKQREFLTEEQQTFLMYYRKFMPVIDSDCVMNKICKHIESIDFKIKQKVKNSSDFDYKTLLSQNFSINKKLYAEIREMVINTINEWQDMIKYEKMNGIEKNTTSGLSQKKYEKDVQMQVLKEKLENICSNEEQLKNHLVYLFYEDRPSLNKAILWNLVGKSIYEGLKERTNYFYFPVKNKNGTLNFLYEKYSIERIAVDKVVDN